MVILTPDPRFTHFLMFILFEVEPAGRVYRLPLRHRHRSRGNAGSGIK
jgi:hypothetical protein